MTYGDWLIDHGLNKGAIWPKEELPAYAFKHEIFENLEKPVAWNDGIPRYFRVSLRNLENKKFRDSLFYAFYQVITEKVMPDIPEGYNIKLFSLPEAGNTIATFMNDYFSIPAVRIRKDCLLYLDLSNEYKHMVENLGEKDPELKDFIDQRAKEYMARALPGNDGKVTKGKNPLLDGSLEKNDAVVFIDNVTSGGASKEQGYYVVEKIAESKNLVVGEDIKIFGSVVGVLNSKAALKALEKKGLKTYCIWSLPELEQRIYESIVDNQNKGPKEQIDSFNELERLRLKQIGELGWSDLRIPTV